MSVKIRTNFTFRIDTWTADGESIVEHVAGVEDYQVALATYRAACLRWPGTPHHLAAGCASDRGQSASAHGVIPSERRTFREVKKAPAFSLPGLQGPLKS
jgi:hypothetical protein